MNRRLLYAVALPLIIALVSHCASAPPSPRNVSVTTTEYTESGQMREKTVEERGEIVSQLRRVFETTVLVGEGVFDNSNEGLARRSALALAVADLAAKVQSEVRANTVVYQNQDVRDVVETNVRSLVRNYEIDLAGYDPNSSRFRVRVSIQGETLVREIARKLER